MNAPLAPWVTTMRTDVGVVAVPVGVVLHQPRAQAARCPRRTCNPARRCRLPPWQQRAPGRRGRGRLADLHVHDIAACRFPVGGSPHHLHHKERRNVRPPRDLQPAHARVHSRTVSEAKSLSPGAKRSVGAANTSGKHEAQRRFGAPQAERSASVGDTRDALIAGYTPAITPMATAAANPPIKATGGMITRHPWASEYP